MTKRQKLTPSSKPATKKRTSAKGKAVTAPPVQPHAIDIGLYASRLMQVFRRHAVVIWVFTVCAISLCNWNMEPLRKQKAAEPYLAAVCFAQWYANNLQHHLRDARSPAVLLIREDLKVLESLIDDNCYADTAGLTRLEIWIRDWQSRQRTPNAPVDPLPQPDASIYQVAYEGVTP